MRLNHRKIRNRFSFFPSTFEVSICTTLLANLAFILLQTFVSIFFHQTGSGKKGLLHYIHFPPGALVPRPRIGRSPPGTLAPRKEETHLPPCTAPAHQSFPGGFPREFLSGISLGNFPPGRKTDIWPLHGAHAHLDLVSFLGNIHKWCPIFFGLFWPPPSPPNVRFLRSNVWFLGPF